MCAFQQHFPKSIPHVAVQQHFPKSLPHVVVVAAPFQKTPNAVRINLRASVRAAVLVARAPELSGEAEPEPVGRGVGRVEAVGVGRVEAVGGLGVVR